MYVLILPDKRRFLSKELLLERGYDDEQIKKWLTRETVERHVDKGRYYYSYDDVIEKTRSGKLLPSFEILLQQQIKNERIEGIYIELLTTQTFNFTKYLPEFEGDQVLTTKEKTEAAKLCAVWHCLYDLRNKGNRDLKFQYDAFRKLYPEKYKGKTGMHSFSRSLKKCQQIGITRLSVDGKKYGNNREENARFNKAALKYITTLLVADGGNMYSCTELLSLVNQYAKEHGYPQVSLSWIKKYRADILKNILIAESRYGKQEATRLLPHTKFIAATQSNYQWQIDGIRPAFWGDKFESYSYVRVLDSHSKKILGWSIGKTENTVTIVDAIRDAVKNTSCLPLEFVADNHSFNKSQEAANLQRLFDSKGSTWSIDSNPRRKIIIERENQNINKLCKRYYGYLGQGIKSKSIEAHPKDELKAEYASNFYSEQEIKAIMLNVTHEYNNTPLKNGKTPNGMYAESTPDREIKVTMWEWADLLNMQIEKQIRSGQITFVRGIDKIEFQLPANLFRKYNDTKVLVKYSDLKEGIYLFDIKTGECFADLMPKEAIHNAIADQTQKDIDILHRQAGKQKGIKTQAARELEKLTGSGLAVDSSAYARASKMTTSKDILKELEQNGLQQQAADRNIKTDLIQPVKIKQSISALRPKETEQINPFKVKDNVMGKIVF